MNPTTPQDVLLSRLTQAERADSLDDEDFAENLVAEQATSVLTYEWDSQMPGASGTSWVSYWRGLYFVAGSDCPNEGPFESVEGAFRSEAFETLSGGLVFTHTGRRVKRSKLLDLIARSFAGNEGDTIRVNGATYVYGNGRFTKSRGTLPVSR